MEKGGEAAQKCGECVSIVGSNENVHLDATAGAFPHFNYFYKCTLLEC